MSVRIRAALAFALQVVVGGLMFLVVFAVAGGVGLVVRWAEHLGVAPPWLTTGTGYIEVVVWLVDVGLYALFILVEAIKFVRTLWGELRE